MHTDQFTPEAMEKRSQQRANKQPASRVRQAVAGVALAGTAGLAILGLAANEKADNTRAEKVERSALLGNGEKHNVSLETFAFLEGVKLWKTPNKNIDSEDGNSNLDSQVKRGTALIASNAVTSETNGQHWLGVRLYPDRENLEDQYVWVDQNELIGENKSSEKPLFHSFLSDSMTDLSKYTVRQTEFRDGMLVAVVGMENKGGEGIAGLATVVADHDLQSYTEQNHLRQVR